MKLHYKIIVISILLLLLANVFLWQTVFSFDGKLRITFFNVGQGDAIFIETPQHFQILVDGGPSSVILKKLEQKMPFWDRTIDLVVLTHPEKDHLKGLFDVFRRYQVRNFLWTGIRRETLIYQEWQKLLAESQVDIFIMRKPMKALISNVMLEFLYPLENLEGKYFKDSNDTSIVSRLVFGQNSILLMGDAGQRTEKELTRKEKNFLPSSILKVGHHGSKSASSESFLRDVSPLVAVISVGANNKYGHPARSVLQRLGKFGINILRTDQVGDVEIISSGQNFQIITQD